MQASDLRTSIVNINLIFFKYFLEDKKMLRVSLVYFPQNPYFAIILSHMFLEELLFLFKVKLEFKVSLRSEPLIPSPATQTTVIL